MPTNILVHFVVPQKEEEKYHYSLYEIGRGAADNTDIGQRNRLSSDRTDICVVGSLARDIFVLQQFEQELDAFNVNKNKPKKNS